MFVQNGIWFVNCTLWKCSPQSTCRAFECMCSLQTTKQKSDASDCTKTEERSSRVATNWPFVIDLSVLEYCFLTFLFCFLAQPSSIGLNCNQCNGINASNQPAESTVPSKDTTFSPPINPYRRPSYLNRKEIALLRSRKLLAQVISNNARNSIDEDDDAVACNEDATLHVNVNTNKINKKVSPINCAHSTELYKKNAHIMDEQNGKTSNSITMNNTQKDSQNNTDATTTGFKEVIQNGPNGTLQTNHIEPSKYCHSIVLNIFH